MAGTVEVPFFSLLSSRSGPAFLLSPSFQPPSFHLPHPLTQLLHLLPSRASQRDQTEGPVGERGSERRGSRLEEPGGKQQEKEEPEVWRGQGLLLLSSRDSVGTFPRCGVALTRAPSLRSFTGGYQDRTNSRASARIRSYERTRACGTRTRRAWREKRERERGKEGKRETVASLVLRRPRALHSTQRRANPMGP